MLKNFRYPITAVQRRLTYSLLATATDAQDLACSGYNFIDASRYPIESGGGITGGE